MSAEAEHLMLQRQLSKKLANGLALRMGPEDLAYVAIGLMERWHSTHGCPESEAAYVRGVRAGRAGEE